MEAEQILEVINKLVGEITPAGATHIDDERTENLKVYLEIWDKMHTEIDHIVCRYSNSHEWSIKRMVQMCEDTLDRIGIPKD